MISRAGRFAVATGVVLVSLLVVSGAGGSHAQTPRVGGTVAFGLLEPEPACLNALLAGCAQAEATRFVSEMILQPAFDVRPEYTYRPRLVSGVDFTTQPPFTLTYHIRRQARWSDGVPITARDFVFTHRARVATKTQLSESEREDLRRVRRVSALDAKTVRVLLRSRFSGWRSLFANVLPSHALQGEDVRKIWSDRIDNPKTGRPIGSGPFLLESWERGRQLTLVRNPRYWGAHRAYLDRIVVRFRLESENPVDWFRNGELDVAYALFPNVVSALRREPGVRVLAEPSAGYQSFAFRLGPGGHPALRQKLVRRALAYGIDRDALVREVPGEINPNLRPLQSLLFLVQSPYYRPNWRGYRYRPALARRLLEQARCRRGADGVYSCAGERLSLRFVTSAGNPSRARILSLVQAQLRRSGVEVVPSFAPAGTFLGTILPSGDFDAALFGFFSAPNPTGNTIFGCGGSQNFTGYCQRLVTRDLDQADRILDARQQARVLNRADAQIARDVPVLPLFQVPLATAARGSVRNFAQALNPLTNSENWWLER
jgi:peptide/nickel transport system substrate-binding protein